MIERTVARLVGAACRFPWITLLAGLALSVAATVYAATNFAITTDTNKLISPHLDWQQRERQMTAAFPQHIDTIAIVIDGATPELAEAAAQLLVAALNAASPKSKLIQTVRQRGAGEFFERNGLLYLSVEEVRRTTEGLITAQPILGTLSADPTLNGLARALSFVPAGIDADRATMAQFEKPLTVLAAAIEGQLAGKPVPFSWGALLSEETPQTTDRRRFVEVKPVLDFGDLQPGAAATDVIRATIKQLGLTPDKGVNVRLTGPVPLADEEFGSVADGALVNGILTLAAVLLILWMALRSWRIIFAVLVSLCAGLAMTAAAGLAMVGALNLISVAFAVLFIGIGVDFGIQFSVRYREERHNQDDLHAAIRAAATNAGRPLALAAAATSLGFLAFLPTDYRGVSELGLIAGIGMLIAFLTSITILPALLVLLNPPGERHEVGYRMLAPVDRFMARHRRVILSATAIGVVAGLPLLARLEFDFNPINLRAPTSESVSTLFDLMRDPATSPNTIEVLTPSLAAAEALAARLAALPEAARTLTLASFVPDEQAAKLDIITDAATLLLPTLQPTELEPAPTDSETRLTLAETAVAYANLGVKSDGAALAVRMSNALRRLSEADPQTRTAVETALLSGLKLRLQQISTALGAEPVTLKSLPKDLIADWIASDGRARVEISPKGDSNDNAVLRRFAAAVLAVTPDATGTPILIQESAKTVIQSFTQAAALALLSITILLYVALRRVSDVLMTLVPLLLAAVVTLELMVLIKLPLNFANIIALPLLLGVGVAFKIYYVLAWRGGQTSLLASPLTRAVIYSAMTTAIAFGSLWFSQHPGTSSMGELLGLSLVTTLAAAVVFQPILMGPPRAGKGTAAPVA